MPESTSRLTGNSNCGRDECPDPSQGCAAGARWIPEFIPDLPDELPNPLPMSLARRPASLDRAAPAGILRTLTAWQANVAP